MSSMRLNSRSPTSMDIGEFPWTCRLEPRCYKTPAAPCMRTMSRYVCPINGQIMQRRNSGCTCTNCCCPLTLMNIGKLHSTQTISEQSMVRNELLPPNLYLRIESPRCLPLTPEWQCRNNSSNHSALIVHFANERHQPSLH